MRFEEPARVCCDLPDIGGWPLVVFTCQAHTRTHIFIGRIPHPPLQLVKACFLSKARDGTPSLVKIY